MSDKGLFLAAETLTGDRVLTEAEVANYRGVEFDPGGAGRNVDLPATTNLAGHRFLIVYTADAAEDLTVRLTAGGATVATVSQNEHAVFTCTSATAGKWFGGVQKNT